MRAQKSVPEKLSRADIGHEAIAKAPEIAGRPILYPQVDHKLDLYVSRSFFLAFPRLLKPILS